MTWRTEWKAISDEISGILEAGKFYVMCLSIRREDSYAVAYRELIPHIEKVFESLRKFHATYQALFPPAAALCLKTFLERGQKYYRPNANMEPLTIVQGLLIAITSFRSEFAYQISESSAVAKLLTERAFSHLQRSIVADESLRDRWTEAFEKGETACERLGGAHLLLHGIWAFKVTGEGERTDLVLSQPLIDFSEVERTAEALVLTEWKKVSEKNELEQRIREAHHQAARYAQGVLGGLELAQYRYLVMVSKDMLAMPGDFSENDVIYRHINIAVAPKSPSRG